MAKVLLHTAALENPKVDELHQGAYQQFLQSSRIDLFGKHHLTTDPQEADIIIFAEVGAQGLFAEIVRHHEYVKRYREKCFIFDPGDYSLPFLPGLYASLEKKHHDPTRTRTGYYLRFEENPYLEFRPINEEPKYLGVFIGSFSSYPLRASLNTLSREKFLVEDNSELYRKMLTWSAEDQRDGYYSHYVSSIAGSAFSLCPRGVGASSIRLFESMQVGRCPVIVSDDWIYPNRVDWASCSVTIAEKDILRLEEILEERKPEAKAMGLRARQEWEKFYAPNVRFHWLVEDCLELQQMRRRREGIAGRFVWLNLLNFTCMRRYLSSKRQIYAQQGRILL